MRGKSHAANPDKSPRLLRFLGALSDGQWHSTMQIIQAANITAVNSAAHECREAGHLIDCERRDGAFYYRLRRIHREAA